MNCLAIIPARSGSKGLIDKNIKELNGKPLLAYTIEAAREAGIFAEIMVSTDSEIYARISEKYGAKVPFLRSEALSSDDTSSWEVVKEVIKIYRQMKKEYSMVALLQPTSPLRNAENIKGAYKLYKEKSANTVVSVCEVDHPIQWCFELGADNNMDSFAKSCYRNTRRQDIPLSYRENGAIYMVNTKLFDSEKIDIYEDKCFGYVMKNEDSIDIDDEIDFNLANIYIKNKSLR